MENKSMDPKLEAAALSGDVAFLEETLDSCQSNNNDYSCLLSCRQNRKKEVGNIFHLAAWSGKEEFFRKARESLPISIVQSLLSQQEPSGGKPNLNPLHVAALGGHLGIVKIILLFYRSLISHYSSFNNPCCIISKPWLARDSRGSTPLHLALEKLEPQCAIEILSMDMESLCKLNDNDGDSPLFLAVQNKFNQVALEIVTSTHSYSISGRDGSTPLHFVPYCSGEVCRALLKEHPDLVKAIDRDGYTVLHRWVAIGEVWPLEYLIKSDDIASNTKEFLLDLISTTDKRGDNPFHVAARSKNVQASRILAKVYKENRSRPASSTDQDLVPWLIPNNDGQTPMWLALKYDEARKWYSITFGDKIQIHSPTQTENGPLFLAVKGGPDKVADQIWDTQLQYGWITSSSRGWKILLDDALNYSVEVARWVGTKFPSLISEPDEVAKTLLEASIAGHEWLVGSMLKKYPSALQATETSQLIWVEACKKGYLRTIIAFIDNCPNFRQVCIENLCTPLHHIQFGGYEQYRYFLKHPIMWDLKNFQDSDGATPLHRAIGRRDIHLTEVLLNMDDVNRSIQDRDHKTAMDLLVQACVESPKWDKMCRGFGLIMKATYFQDMKKLLEVRDTLSVVAALLATITFTAGFTIPGGFNSDTGEALLADKAAFLVFLLANAFAMCLSMLVLVCLIWSMCCDRERSLLLIDRSMSMLLIALYSTLVAFMTGVYTVIHHKTLWAAVIILVMCSAVIISSKRKITLKVLDKLNLVTDPKRRDVEQGEASTCSGRSSSRVHEKACSCWRSSSSEHK